MINISEEKQKEVENVLMNVFDDAKKGCSISLLDDWSRNKEDIYHMFGDQLIIRKEVNNIQVANEEVKEEMYNFFRYCYNNYIFPKCDIRYYNQERDGELYNEKTDNIDNQHARDFHRFIMTNGIESFRTNKTTVDFIYKREDKVIKIQKNSKLSKAFHFFIQDRRNLSELQDFYSQIMQKKFKRKNGYVCLSIDPMDYLSISNNDANWDNCHNINDGDYRGGNLNYMADTCTVVGYFIKEEDEEDLYNHNIFRGSRTPKWNSKEWRVLVEMKIEKEEEKGLILYSKQYPYQCPNFLKNLDELLMSKVEIEMNPLVYVENGGDKKLSVVSHLVMESDYFSGYFDIFLQSKPRMHYRISENLKKNEADEGYFMVIGAPILCLKCGEGIVYDGYSCICDECEDNATYCGICGERIDSENSFWDKDREQYICLECLEENYTTCKRCGTRVENDSIITDINGIDDVCLCPECVDFFNKEGVKFDVFGFDSLLNSKDGATDKDVVRILDYKPHYHTAFDDIILNIDLYRDDISNNRHFRTKDTLKGVFSNIPSNFNSSPLAVELIFDTMENANFSVEDYNDPFYQKDNYLFDYLENKDNEYFTVKEINFRGGFDFSKILPIAKHCKEISPDTHIIISLLDKNVTEEQMEFCKKYKINLLELSKE